MDGGDPGRAGRPGGRSVRGQVHAALDVLGGGGRRKAYGAAAAQHVGRQCGSAVLSIITGGGKWVEMTVHGRPALPAPSADRRAEVLALCPEWRAPSPVRRRAAKTQGRSGPDCRHERLQQPGPSSQPPIGGPGLPTSSMTGEGGLEGWYRRMPGRPPATAARQAVESGAISFDSWRGGRPCTAPAIRSAPSRRPGQGPGRIAIRKSR